MDDEQSQQGNQPSDTHRAHPPTITIDGATFAKVPYDDRGHRLDAVSISRKGRIGLPNRLVATIPVGRRRRAHLYWDGKARAIAIVLVENDLTAFPVNPVAGGRSYIAADSFFKAYDLRLEGLAAQYRYEAKPVRDLGIRNVSEDHKACIVVLDSEQRIARSVRSRQQSVG